jgi:hypothetical protein
MTLRAPALAVIALCVTICGCTSATQSNPPQTDKVLARTDVGVVRAYEGGQSGTIVVHGSSDAVFNALRSSYADLGVELKVDDPPRGEIGNREFSRMYRMAGESMSHFVGCGITETGQAADKYRITMALVSSVIAVPDGWKIDTRLDAHADDLASSKGMIACQTRGTLEGEINALVAKRLGS